MDVYILVIGKCKKPTAHSSTFGFCRLTNPKRKPKKLEFLPMHKINRVI